ncbi:flagellar biosynthetic protein FliQ [Eisenbergiella tayi]|uniref:flagellar biosynthesis protein FliQ n=1 Tax=Eisenbergiella tayi TaxID=1432052 RepID=UPI0008FD6D22|nr:flagellar biosynthesis protein FliQ [Eisenbergiella tayi]OIZ64312.1 flagellar biosynthetic protein FliQ [Eisenbergiella tayi]
MTNGEVSDLMYKVFIMALQLGGPVLVVSMAVGIIISILQAATQIHEQTLTFVPKLLVIAIILVFTGSNMLQSLQDFTKEVFALITAI